MKSVLIIGNVNSTFVIGLINNLKSYDPSLRVDCLSTVPIEQHKATPDNIYTNPMCEWWKAKFGKKVRYGWLLGVLHWFFFRKNRIHYDNIQIHYVDILHHLAVPVYRLSTKKLTAVIWGSDLMRCGRKDILSTILNQCNSINCQTVKMQAGLRELLNKRSQKKVKFTHNLFGLEPIDEIRKLKIQNIPQDKLCDQLDLPENKKIILVGYSATPAHQHLAIVAELRKHQELLQDCCFVFPFTYGKFPDYVNLVKQELNNSKLYYKIFDNFLNNADIAKLRLSTHVCIIMPTTDSASGTVMEHLYAGSTLITGDWIDYSMLKELGAHFHSIKSIPDDLASCLLNVKNTKGKTDFRQIASICDWQHTVKGWHDMIVR